MLWTDLRISEPNHSISCKQICISLAQNFIQCFLMYIFKTKSHCMVPNFILASFLRLSFFHCVSFIFSFIRWVHTNYDTQTSLQSSLLKSTTLHSASLYYSIEFIQALFILIVSASVSWNLCCAFCMFAHIVHLLSVSKRQSLRIPSELHGHLDPGVQSSGKCTQNTQKIDCSKCAVQ